MTSDLLKQSNIGKDTATKLILVDINSIEELQAVGAEQAFIRLQTLDPGACINLLYGLEGAIEGIQSSKLSDDKKHELLEFYKIAKRHLKTD
ncbi:MAG: TfoX/Sxy family DNA transformation protein [Paludibacter sp.]